MTVALYVRCSTTEQHPDAHLGPLRAWAAAHGQGAVEYVDEGVSGAKARRSAPGARCDAASGARGGGPGGGGSCPRPARARRREPPRHRGRAAGAQGRAGVLARGPRSGEPGREGALHHARARGRARASLDPRACAPRDRRGPPPGHSHRTSPRLDADARARARRMHEAGQTIAHIAETLGCLRPSVQRALGILR